jgi:hypothetical protein
MDKKRQFQSTTPHPSLDNDHVDTALQHVNKKKNKSNMNRKHAPETPSITCMVDSTNEYASKQYATLQQQLHDNGYLLIRNFLPIDKSILSSFFQSLDAIIVRDQKFGKSFVSHYRREKSITMNVSNGDVIDMYSGYNSKLVYEKICSTHAIQSVIAYCEMYLKQLFQHMHSGNSSNACHNDNSMNENKIFTIYNDQTWLRFKGIGDITVPHADYYHGRIKTTMYMKKVTSNTGINSNAANNLNDNPNDKHENKNCDSTICNGCNRMDHESKLFCNMCELHWHLTCFNAYKYKSIPEDKVWYCHKCSTADIPHYTIWLPLMPMMYEHGMLQLLSQSHSRYKQWLNPTANGLSSGDVPNLPGDYQNDTCSASYIIDNTSNRDSDKWVSYLQSPLNPGDVIVFNCKTIHAASKNNSKDYRFSMDVRCSYK